MLNSIQSTNDLKGMLPTSPGASLAATPGESPEVDFSKLLQQALEQTSNTEIQSQQAIEQLLAGEDITRAEVFSAVKKADLTLRMMMQVRNKIMEAYDEVKQMRI